LDEFVVMTGFFAFPLIVVVGCVSDLIDENMREDSRFSTRSSDFNRVSFDVDPDDESVESIEAF